MGSLISADGFILTAGHCFPPVHDQKHSEEQDSSSGSHSSPARPAFASVRFRAPAGAGGAESGEWIEVPATAVVVHRKFKPPPSAGHDLAVLQVILPPPPPPPSPNRSSSLSLSPLERLVTRLPPDGVTMRDLVDSSSSSSSPLLLPPPPPVLAATTSKDLCHDNKRSSKILLLFSWAFGSARRGREDQDQVSNETIVAPTRLILQPLDHCVTHFPPFHFRPETVHDDGHTIACAVDCSKSCWIGDSGSPVLLLQVQQDPAGSAGSAATTDDRVTQVGVIYSRSRCSCRMGSMGSSCSSRRRESKGGGWWQRATRTMGQRMRQLLAIVAGGGGAERESDRRESSRAGGSACRPEDDEEEGNPVIVYFEILSRDHVRWIREVVQRMRRGDSKDDEDIRSVL